MNETGHTPSPEPSMPFEDAARDEGDAEGSVRLPPFAPDDLLARLARLNREVERVRGEFRSVGASAPGLPSAPPTTGPVGTSPVEEAGSEIAELVRRFIDEVGGLRHKAQVAADAARVAHANAERMRQEANRLRSEAEAEAIRILDAARDEASRIREEAQTRAAEAERVVRGVVGDIERAQEGLSDAIDRFAAHIVERTAADDVVVVPESAAAASEQSDRAADAT